MKFFPVKNGQYLSHRRCRYLSCAEQFNSTAARGYHEKTIHGSLREKGCLIDDTEKEKKILRPKQEELAPECISSLNLYPELLTQFEILSRS